MNKNTLGSILQEIAEKEIPPETVNLLPKLNVIIIGSKYQNTKNSLLHRPLRGLVQIGIAITLGLVFFFASVFSPQIKTFAQEVISYFTTLSQKTIPAPLTDHQVPTFILADDLVTVPQFSPDNQNCQQAASPIDSTFLCQLEYAQTSLGFTVKSFSKSSVTVPFFSMAILPDQKRVEMIFRNDEQSFRLDEGQGDFPRNAPGLAIFQDGIQRVNVDEYQGEFAKGQFVFTENGSMVWQPEDPIYHLRWKENSLWYSLTLSGTKFEAANSSEIQERMLNIAKNLVDISQPSNLLAASDQPSIKDSLPFTISRIHLLPQGFQQVTDQSWSNLTSQPRVSMSYAFIVDSQQENTITLIEMLRPSDNKTLRNEYAYLYQQESLHNGQGVDQSIGEKVNIKGNDGFYLEGVNSNSTVLYWWDNQKEYLLINLWNSNYGGRLEKSTLIQIAESIQ